MGTYKTEVSCSFVLWRDTNFHLLYSSPLMPYIRYPWLKFLFSLPRWNASHMTCSYEYVFLRILIRWIRIHCSTEARTAVKSGTFVWLKHASAHPKFNKKWHTVTWTQVVWQVRASATKLDLGKRGLDADLLGAHSLCAGGAMALDYMDSMILPSWKWVGGLH